MEENVFVKDTSFCNIVIMFHKTQELTYQLQIRTPTIFFRLKQSRFFCVYCTHMSPSGQTQGDRLEAGFTLSQSTLHQLSLNHKLVSTAVLNTQTHNYTTQKQPSCRWQWIYYSCLVFSWSGVQLWCRQLCIMTYIVLILLLMLMLMINPNLVLILA